MFSLTVSSLLQLVVAASPSTSTYNDAYNQSIETGRPLVVLVGADWCPHCVQMKTSVIPQLAKDGSLGKVAFATINTDKDRALADKLMTGGSIPQLIMYHKTPEGWKRTQLIGAQSSSTINAMFDRGVKESEHKVASGE